MLSGARGQATVLHSSGAVATHQITREPKVPTDGSWGSGSTGSHGRRPLRALIIVNHALARGEAMPPIEGASLADLAPAYWGRSVAHASEWCHGTVGGVQDW